MITVLLQQILDLLAAHFPGVITLLEKLNLIEPDVEEIRQDVDIIRNTANVMNGNIQLVYTQARLIKDNTDLIKADTANISSNSTTIANNIGTISTNTGRAASFAEDCANNTLDIDQKITSIASDTTQMRADNQTLISNTNDIESYLLAMSYGLVKTTAANGNPINFNTDLIEELPLVRAEITPIQAGSGTPSPANPRALSGISSLDVVLNGDTTSISLGGPIYKGNVDVTNGNIIKTHDIFVFDGSEAWSLYDTHIFRLITTGYNWLPNNSLNWGKGYLSNIMQTDTRSPNVAGLLNNSFYITSQYIYARFDDYNTLTDFTTALTSTPLQLIAPISTPAASTTTPATFTSTPGDNQISANSNADLTITYKESVANYIANNT